MIAAKLFILLCSFANPSKLFSQNLGSISHTHTVSYQSLCLFLPFFPFISVLNLLIFFSYIISPNDQTNRHSGVFITL